MSTSDFTFLWIPDIHLEKYGQPASWVQQVNWIQANQSLYNIQAVFCAGDVEIQACNPATAPVGQYQATQDCGGSDTLLQDLPPAWNEGFSIIDGLNLPYLVTVGNHDFDNIYDTTNFDLYISYSRINQKPWYFGYWNAPGMPPVTNPGSPSGPPTGNPSKATQAIKFTVGNRQVLVIAPEYGPRQGALCWAGDLITANPTCDVIILPHGYMTNTGDLLNPIVPTTQQTYTSTAGATVNMDALTGPDINTWFMQFPNARLALCGHCFPAAPATGPSTANRVDTASDGHPILGIIADYQNNVPSSQIVLLLQVTGSQAKVRVFNTSTGEEQFTPSYTDANGVEQFYCFPYTLPWGSWPLLQAAPFQALSATEVLVLDSNYNLWLEQGPFGTVPPARQQIDATVVAFQALSATEVLVLGTNGNLWLEQGPFGTVPPARQQIDGSVRAFQALSATEVLVLGSNGYLWLEQGPFGTVPPARQQIDAGAQAFQALSATQVLVLGSNGYLWLEQGPFGTVPPPRQLVSANVQAFQGLSATEVVVLDTSGDLWLEYWPFGPLRATLSPIAGSQALSDAKVAVPGSHATPMLERLPFGPLPSSRQQIDANVQAFQALSDTEVVVLGTNGNLWLEHAPFGTVPPTRQQIDGSVQAFQALSDSAVLVLGTNGNLWLEYGPFGTVPPTRQQIDGDVLLA